MYFYNLKRIPSHLLDSVLQSVRFPWYFINQDVLEGRPLSLPPRLFNGLAAISLNNNCTAALTWEYFTYHHYLDWNCQCRAWFYVHLGCFHLYVILHRPFGEICFHKFAAIWQSLTSGAKAHIYRHLWLATCEICQRRAEPFGPRLQIVSQWCAHQAAARARCSVHGNNSEEQYQQSRSNKLPSQENTGLWVYKTFLCTFYSHITAVTSVNAAVSAPGVSLWTWHTSFSSFRFVTSLVVGYALSIFCTLVIIWSFLHHFCAGFMSRLSILECTPNTQLTNTREKEQHSAGFVKACNTR